MRLECRCSGGCSKVAGILCEYYDPNFDPVRDMPEDLCGNRDSWDFKYEDVPDDPAHTVPEETVLIGAGDSGVRTPEEAIALLANSLQKQIVPMPGAVLTFQVSCDLNLDPVRGSDLITCVMCATGIV